MATLGFIGLGTMGKAMARLLVEAGHRVLVWNRSPEAVEGLVAAGAVRVPSPAEALAAEVSFSMLANDAAMDAVFTEEALGALAGRTHVAMASISPALADRLAERFRVAGAAYLAAPVLGRPDVAAAGQLNILAAGAADVIDRVEPYLLLLGKRIWRIAEKPSAANVVKTAVNYNIIHALQALGESVALTERAGVEPERFVELLVETIFPGAVFGGYGRMIAAEAYLPAGFTVALGRKDLRLAEDVAAAEGVTLATMPALVSVFDRALQEPLLREADWGAVAEVTRRDLL